jgi:hypothetical protein
MRFYLKLLPFVLAFVGMERSMALYAEQIRDAMFALRCGHAYRVRDQVAMDRLVDEWTQRERMYARAQW